MSHTEVILGMGLFFSIVGNVGFVLAMWEREKPHPLPDSPTPMVVNLSPDDVKQMHAILERLAAIEQALFLPDGVFTYRKNQTEMLNQIGLTTGRIEKRFDLLAEHAETHGENYERIVGELVATNTRLNRIEGNQKVPVSVPALPKKGRRNRCD